MTQVHYANDSEVAAKVMDGEAILINLGTGIYYSLDDVASSVWSSIEQGATTEQVAAQVCAQFDCSSERALADVPEFLATLHAEGLIRTAEEEPCDRVVTTAVAGKAGYATPSMEKFDDMAEMFALDPPLPGLAQTNPS